MYYHVCKCYGLDIEGLKAIIKYLSFSLPLAVITETRYYFRGKSKSSLENVL